MVLVHPSTFLTHGESLLKCSPYLSSISRGRRFRATFGTNPYVCSKIWRLLHEGGILPRKGKPEHLLWALMFMKLYGSETIHASLTGTNETTFRKWSWLFVSAIADLDVVSNAACCFFHALPCWLSFFSLWFQICWENRNVGHNGSRCRVSIDGTDFRIYEPTPFSKSWFSHKFKGAGLRYEVGIAIQTGWIVWIHGSFPCGDWPDLAIARHGVCNMVDDGELLIADGGYHDGEQYFVTPNGLNNYEQYLQSVVRARHETVNQRFKQWAALERVFRHDVMLHPRVFHAIANIVQITIVHGEPLFSVKYDDV